MIRKLCMLASFVVIATFSTGCDTVQQVSDFIDAISDGAPCTINRECLGNRCLTDEQGYPGGYCSTFDCENEGCSGFASECFRTDIDGQQVTACFELCDFDGTCDRASEGYTCVTLDDTAVCLPPGATNAPPQGSTGSACSADVQCNGDNNVCLTTFFGGYCSQESCDDPSVDCLGGNPCVPVDPANASAGNVCLLGCATDDECRFGYACQDLNGVRVCLEGERTAKNPDGVDDGGTCNSNLNCKGGTCIREATNEDTGEVAFPGGYCTTRDCEGPEDCNGDSICVARARFTACFQRCETDTDCRDGYACTQTPEGNICDSVVEAPEPDPDSSEGVEVTCQSSKTIDFTIPNGAIGFYIAPFSRQNVEVRPTNLRLPSGQNISIPDQYSWMAINPDILGNLAPILFPSTDASPLSSSFGPGEYSMTVSSPANEICYYVIPKLAEGTQIDVNLYFVGVPGLTASAAQSDGDIRQVVQVMQSIYQTMGINVTIANYFDATESVAQQYSIIRNFNDVFTLAASSQAPGNTLDENLSVNVFLINDFNISEAPGLLGVSNGIPGMAGLHGNSGAGLVFSTASLGSDNGQLGQTMAHEIGHFLGLRHTTEHLGSAHDPITDTPECFAPDLQYFCDDAKNFMFAFALGSDQRRTTAGQAFVVRRSPLVK
jgi:hypothetical protein